MKIYHSFAVFAVSAFVILSCAGRQGKTEPADHVDPFIGTGGHGHTFPGPTVPHGMIQPGPDTRISGWDACGGYHYSDSTINGFSHTHLSGTGCCDLGDILIMPTVGEQKYDYQGPGSQRTAYASGFSHGNETASPGYYSVFLDTYGVGAELTATKRAAIHRYTFPESSEAGFIVDLDYSLQNQTNSEMELEVVGDIEIRGGKKTAYWAFDQYVYFHAVFSKPFTYTIVDDSVATAVDTVFLPRKKALLKFATDKNEKVFVKIGISAVDADGARRNLESEIPDWDFDRVRLSAREAWNEWLKKIDVTTGDSVQKKVFYTALYHTAVAPNLFTDADGRYRGTDLAIHRTSPERPIYTTFSLWDTFRALHPLITIIDPKLNNDFVYSLIDKADKGGILPMWELWGNYTGTMIGYHAVSVIYDAYIKGMRDYDIHKAFEACLKVATYDTTGIKCPPEVLPLLMPKSKQDREMIGYIPCDWENESVAKGLEYAYDDWCIAQFARKMRNNDEYGRFSTLAYGYNSYFDQSTRFMRGIDSRKEWRTPFNPRASEHRTDDYCEGTAWQWTWFVPHDIEGLVKLMGGREAFTGKLDSLFTVSSSVVGKQASSDISGMIGQYAHGNEPSHHIIHLYNYIDEPWKTQALADTILRHQYAAAPDGIAGNEDCGQMSAWYVLNAMGFYQVCPGDPVYSIGRPLFDKTVINLSNGRKLEIIAENNSPENKYIASATLNGNPLAKPFITHDNIMIGGKLVLGMTGSPCPWNAGN